MAIIQLTNNGLFYPVAQVLVDADVEIVSMDNIFLDIGIALYDTKDTGTELEPTRIIFSSNTSSNIVHVLLPTQNAFLALDIEARAITATGSFGTHWHGYPLNDPRDLSQDDGGIFPNFWPISSLVQVRNAAF